MDAVVMSTAGRTGLAHLVIGSVAEKVVRHSPIPVVTLRARRGRRAAKARR
jgi:nucleotide-binding universal stress UspA family protein